LGGISSQELKTLDFRKGRILGGTDWKSSSLAYFKGGAISEETQAGLLTFSFGMIN